MQIKAELPAIPTSIIEDAVNKFVREHPEIFVDLILDVQRDQNPRLEVTITGSHTGTSDDIITVAVLNSYRHEPIVRTTITQR